jgi:hypothetical protein
MLQHCAPTPKFFANRPLWRTGASVDTMRASRAELRVACSWRNLFGRARGRRRTGWSCSAGVRRGRARGGGRRGDDQRGDDTRIASDIRAREPRTSARGLHAPPWIV